MPLNLRQFGLKALLIHVLIVAVACWLSSRFIFLATFYWSIYLGIVLASLPVQGIPRRIVGAIVSALAIVAIVALIGLSWIWLAGIEITMLVCASMVICAAVWLRGALGYGIYEMLGCILVLEVLPPVAIWLIATDGDYSRMGYALLFIVSQFAIVVPYVLTNVVLSVMSFGRPRAARGPDSLPTDS